MVVLPLVALAWEVDPLRVPELVAHEVEVALAADGHGDHPDHLVQRHAPGDHVGGLLEGAHAVVHLGIHEPERDRLITHDGLIVRFGVPDALLGVSAVAQRGDDVVHAPVLILQPGFPRRLECSDPEVGDGHREPSVEPDAALLHRSAQRGHPGHVLGDDLDSGVALVKHIVGHHEVIDRGNVGLHAEVLLVVARKLHLEAVVVVQHGRDAVEAEPVEAVLVHPVPQVGQEVPLHLPVTVVVNPGVPEPVVAVVAGAKVGGLGVLAKVVSRDAILDVARHVAMDDVQKAPDAHSVSLIHEVLEILGGTAPRRHREWVGDVVPEGAVVRVLHHSHQLHGVVTPELDPREDIVGKLSVGVNLGIFAAHAHVRFVDAAGCRALGPWVDALVLLARGWVPVHAVVVRAELGFLRGVGDPRGDAVDPSLV